MSNGYTAEVPSRNGPRALHALTKPLSLVGAWCIAAGRYLTGLIGLGAAVLWQACRLATWPRTVRAEFMRLCAQIALYGLPAILVTGLLIGFAMVQQVLYWLQFAGQEGLIGEFLVLGLVREIAPLLVGMIVLGRSGITMMVELSAMRESGHVHLLEAQGIDPFLYLVMPRVLATALSVYCLTMVFLLVALSAGLAAATVLDLTSLSLLDFIEEVLNAMGPLEYALVPLKTLAMGFAVGLISCTTGLAVGSGDHDVSTRLPQGFVRAVLALMLISGGLTILL
jgi:phospholipid/cholesterol/gamma-HCH transport system permease protein